MALAAAALPFVCLSGLPPNAQSIMRTPSLHVEPRAPSINSNIAPRINSNLGAIAVARTPSPRVSVTPAMHAVPRIGVQSTLPNAHYSPNLSPACGYAYRGSDGECLDRPVVSGDGGGKKGGSAKKGNGGARDNAAQTAVNLQAVPNELVAEIDGTLTDRQVEELARRHGLTRLEARNFPLLGATIGLFRITTAGRPMWCAVNLPVMAAFARSNSISVTCCRTKRSLRPRAIPRNMPWRSFACRRRTRSRAA